MNYEEAKAHRKKIADRNEANAKALKSFDRFGLGSMGLTPENVRAMPEWKEAKAAYDRSFAELRKINGWFVKTFKKEDAAERREKRVIL